MNDNFIRVYPVNSNKLNKYVNSFLDFSNDPTTYNWFFCGQPSSHSKDGISCKIINMSKRASFFDTKSGVTYKINQNVSSCKVLIVEKSNEDINEQLKKSISMGFQGIAYKKDTSNGRLFDLICSGVEFIFMKDALENIEKCPYAEYCKHHAIDRGSSHSSLDLRRNFIKNYNKK